MERSGYLDPLNEVDLYCLHYIYEPLINKCITEFKESWNNHSMSTEGSMSPHQLFFSPLRLLPTASTCSLELRLPTYHHNYITFKEYMSVGLKGCEGFGGV